ncbi:HupE/UreJ family protein [Halopseudomonas pelagia]|uniref:HupE/UreJ family protein n=1 Tax=Halopseudomonas pelagia TaxID=553151 RepID=UPI0003A68844|nr:HupE/UreJ family protein [Halopseudomonas pelagia]|tara:strand:- start:10226 stop:10813 length:588 start_codon:yes stop_codon:yes gene_type:complete
MQGFSSRLMVLVGVFAIPGLAHAHPGHENVSGLMSGLGHPLFGLDHLLAMLAVGLWGAQLGGKARWMLPLLFVGVMLVGGALAMLGLSVPGVEPGIVASVVVLGLFLLWARQVPLAISAALVSIFALFHGVAHGAEMPLQASAMTYALGFAVATAGLHMVGLLAGAWLQQRSWPVVSRVMGAVIGAVGISMAAGM